jgi:hypothetical protein
MKTTLRAEVELWEVEVFAELAVWELRPELQRLCAAVPEGGSLGPEQVDAALPGLSATGRQNLIRHLKYLHILEEDGTLGRAGNRCVETGEAPAWELGVYRFLVAVHPLFERSVLGFQRVSSDPLDRDFEGLGDLPDWLVPAPRRIWRSVFDANEKFTVHSLPAVRGSAPRCRAHQLPPARLEWHIDLDSNHNEWTLSGEVGDADGRKPFRSQPRSVTAAQIAGVFATWDSRYSHGTGRVEIAYDGKAGRETFRRDFRYPRVCVGALGEFEDVLVEDVPVGPSTPAAAQAWALALLLARIGEGDAYVTRAEWAASWDDVVRGTPLNPRAGPAPEPTSLPRTTPPRVRWLTAAATDLAME